MEENEFVECIYEMATIRPLNSLDRLGILLAVNPDINHEGECYFKVYNSTSFYTATKLWRIRFDKPEFIKEHKGKIKSAVSMNSSEKKKLIEYLKLDSKDFKGYSVWDEIKYRWNTEKDLMNQFSFMDYVSGRADEYYKSRNSLNYIPNNLQMPDYMNLHNEKKK